MTQTAVVVILGVAVRIGKDNAVLAGLQGLHVGGGGKPETFGVIWMAERCGWSLGVGLDRGAVFVVAHIAVVALLGLATDTELVADLVD